MEAMFIQIVNENLEEETPLIARKEIRIEIYQE
jgi:hypothetical protein